jgi:hypothetical protein
MMSPNRAFHPPVLGLLALTVAALVGAPAAWATEAPTTATFNISQGSRVPDAAFMQSGSINPSTSDMKGGASSAPEAAPVAAPDVGLQVGESARSYRTLGEAKAAGVNPLDPAKLNALRAAGQPAAGVSQNAKPWLPYVGAGLGSLIVIIIIYAASVFRARKFAVEE